MKLIVLYGGSTENKTAVLKAVFDSLKNKSNNIVDMSKQEYIKYTFDYNGKHVAISSDCNSRDGTCDFISECKNNSVDTLIFAYEKKTICSANIFEADEIKIVHKTQNNQADCDQITQLI